MPQLRKERRPALRSAEGHQRCEGLVRSGRADAGRACRNVGTRRHHQGTKNHARRVRFQLNDVFVRQDAWGTATEFKRGGRRVRLSIPAFAGDPESLAAIPSGFGTRGVRDDETRIWSWSVVSATVSVFGDVDVDLFDLRLDDVRVEAGDKARTFLGE